MQISRRIGVKDLRSMMTNLVRTSSLPRIYLTPLQGVEAPSRRLRGARSLGTWRGRGEGATHAAPSSRASNQLAAWDALAAAVKIAFLSFFSTASQFLM